MAETILIVDDELEIVSFIKDALMDEGYNVLTAYAGDQVFEQLGAKPDLILLDVMMPGMDGLEVCRSIRSVVSCPIVFLSALQQEDDRIKGLMAGGDDYLAKPFSIQELKVRIRAHLRREQRARREPRLVVHDDELTLDVQNYRLLIKGRPVPLTLREFEIVQFLMTHPQQVFTREHIYTKVWGYEAEGDPATVTEHIKKIRAKLAAHKCKKSYIQTIWGIGYRWESDG